MSGDSIPDAVTIQQREIDALADRTLARAVSMLYDVPTGMQTDMFLCVGCLRECARNCPVEGMQIRVWREFM